MPDNEIKIRVAVETAEAERAIDEFENSINKFSNSTRSATAPSREIARALVAAQQQALGLGQTLGRIAAADPLGMIARDAQRLGAETDKLRTSFAVLFQQLSSPDVKNLASINAELERLQARLERISSRAVSLQGAVQIERRIAQQQGQRLPGTDAAQEFGEGVLSGTGLPLTRAAAGAFLGAMAVRGLGDLIRTGREAIDTQRMLAASSRETGIGLDRLEEAARRFAINTGTSFAEASSSTAQLARIVQQIGRAGDFERIQKQILDLAAARGLAARDLGTLMDQLISGQDEALNRLGIANPSQLYEQWARSSGRTVASLTELERLQIRVNAVLEKSRLFNGEAERRAASAAGQLDQLTARIRLSFAAFASRLIENQIGGINLIPIINNAIDIFSKRWKEAIDSLDRQNQNTTDSFAGNFPPVVAIRTAANLLGGLYEAYRRTQDQIEADHYRRVQQIQLEANEQFNQLIAQARRVSEQAQALVRNDPLFRDPFPALRRMREAEARGDFFGAVAARRELDQMRAKLNEEQRKAFDEDLRRFELREAEARRQTLEERLRARETLRQLFTGFVGQGENPVAVLLARQNQDIFELQSRLESIRPAFSAMGEAGERAFRQIAETARRSLEATQANERAAQTFKLQLDALRARQEAARLETFVPALSSVERARVASVSVQTGIVEVLQAEAEARRLRGRAVDEMRLALDQFRALRDLDINTFLEGRAGVEARAVVDQAVKQLFGSLPEQLRQQLPRETIERVAASFERDRERFSARVADAIEQVRVAEAARRDALELVRATTAGRTVSELSNARLRELLNITGALSPEELTGELRAARIEALREQARRDEGREEEARERLANMERLLSAIAAALTEQGIRIVPDAPALVEINVADNKAQVERLGERPRLVPGVRTVGGDF